MVLEIACDWSSERCREAYQNLDETQKARADRYLNESSRRNLIVTRTRLHQVLTFLGQDPGQVRVAENGRPYLSNQTVQFNLSHSQNRAALALSTEQSLTEALGVDLESIERCVDIIAIGRRFFTRDEADWIGDHRGRFFHIWTRKEAVLKSNGIGLRMPLDRFEVLTDMVSDDVTGRPLNLVTRTTQDGFLISLAQAAPSEVHREIHWLDDRDESWPTQMKEIFGRERQ